jgi:hypothetical protein
MKHKTNDLPVNPRQPFFPATLTIDETTAHVTAPSGLSDGLLVRMHQSGIACRLLRKKGVRGLDVIDFGNPPAEREQQIRAIFREFAASACQAANADPTPGELPG